MPAVERLQIVRGCYRAYEIGDRGLLQRTAGRGVRPPATAGDRRRGARHLRVHTEVMTFDGDNIAGTEVYFGWNVE